MGDRNVPIQRCHGSINTLTVRTCELCNFLSKVVLVISSQMTAQSPSVLETFLAERAIEILSLMKNILMIFQCDFRGETFLTELAFLSEFCH